MVEFSDSWNDFKQWFKAQNEGVKLSIAAAVGFVVGAFLL